MEHPPMCMWVGGEPYKIDVVNRLRQNGRASPMFLRA